MASSIQLLRSNIEQERPFPGNLLDGQPAINTNGQEPGLFFKASDGSIVKVGPAAITLDGNPPNTNGTGQLGNTVGELWVDKSNSSAVLKIFDGFSWVNVSGSGGGVEVPINGADIIDQTITGDKIANNASIASSKLTFTQSGIDAISRSVESKISDIISVKDFGAIGDGITNDTAAIQRAINSRSNRRTIYFPAGTYRTSSPITVPNSCGIDAEAALFDRIGPGVFSCFIINGGREPKSIFYINNYDVGIELRGNVNFLVFHTIANCRQGLKIKAISPTGNNLDNVVYGTQIGLCTDGIVFEQDGQGLVQQGNEIRVNFVSETLHSLVFDDLGTHTAQSNWDANLVVLQASDPFFRPGATLVNNRTNFSVPALTYKIESWAGGWNIGDGTIEVLKGPYSTCTFEFSFAAGVGITDFCSLNNRSSIDSCFIKLKRNSNLGAALGNAVTAVTSGQFGAALTRRIQLIRLDISALNDKQVYEAYIDHFLCQTNWGARCRIINSTFDANYHVRVADNGSVVRGQVRFYVTNVSGGVLSSKTEYVWVQFGD
jgi:hypothetical protein